MNGIMNRFYFFLISVLLSVTTLSAQERDSLFDERVAQICSWVDVLKRDAGSYDAVRAEMTGKMYWRLMEEYYENCSDPEGMCSLWDEVEKTGINDTAFQAEKDRGTRPQSTDNFCVGSEMRYHYSLYECSILPHKHVSTFLDQRSGAQLFLIIPYEDDGISVRAFLNEKELEVSASEVREGCLEFNARAEIDDRIRIDVYNGSTSNRSFVLINHNSGR